MRPLAIAGIVKRTKEISAPSSAEAPPTAIAVVRDFQLRRDGRELAVFRRGRRWGAWPRCAPLLEHDLVEHFKAQLAEYLDWELANNFVLEDA